MGQGLRHYSTSPSDRHPGCKNNSPPNRLTRSQRAALSAKLAQNLEFRELLTGLLLGDGHIQKLGENARVCIYNERLRLCQHTLGLFQCPGDFRCNTL
jgi:hypothetical protein